MRMTHSTKAPVHHLPRIVRALKAMAHPVRLRMLAMLTTGELCVCQLTAVLDLAASTVSGHLADLRAAGLVHERKDGKWVHYRLTGDPELSAVIRSALASLARDHQTGTDAAAVRQVRRLPVETVSGGGFDLAAATARGRLCCSASASPAAPRSRPRMAAV
jgi:DNA-binding transcriptional ArsR family regulator